MTRYITRPFNEVLDPERLEMLETLLNVPIIKQAREHGGIIAGGFPRALLLGKQFKEYFNPTQTDPKVTPRPGDIDIFFTSTLAAEKVIDLYSTKMQNSLGGFAKYTTIYGKTLSSSIVVQLVNHPTLCRSSLEEILDSFDFNNCKVAIVGDNIIYPEGWHELESSKRISISSITSPFMGSRLVRYLTSRGMVGVTADSREKLTEWLCAAAISKFDGYMPQHLDGLKTAIMQLEFNDQLNADELVLFIGKWKILTYEKSENYGPSNSVEVDWALKKVQDNDARQRYK